MNKIYLRLLAGKTETVHPAPSPVDKELSVWSCFSHYKLTLLRKNRLPNVRVSVHRMFDNANWKLN